MQAQKSFNTPALEGHQYLYRSIEHFGHTVFKCQGQIPLAHRAFWVEHHQKGGHQVIASFSYLGDRINFDLTRYEV